jgi:hypothetical protein
MILSQGQTRTADLVTNFLPNFQTTPYHFRWLFYFILFLHVFAVLDDLTAKINSSILNLTYQWLMLSWVYNGEMKAKEK